MSTRTRIRSGALAVAVLSTLAACASMAQKGALIGVRKAVTKQDYTTCLNEIAEAESYGEFAEAESAQMSFYKAFCLEGLGRKAEALAVFDNLIQRYPTTDWAAQARARVSTLR